MDMFSRCADPMLPGDEVVAVQPAEWSDGAAHGRVVRRWHACPDLLVVAWEHAPPFQREAIIPRRDLRHEGRCPERLRPGERVRVARTGAALPRGTTGRLIAVNPEGWAVVVPDGSVDTVARVWHADLERG